jgi:hypothetical protein
MPGGEEPKDPKDDTTFNKMKVLLYTQREEDIDDIVKRLWSEETTIEELETFVGRHFYDPDRRETYFFVIHEFKANGHPNPLKSRVFKQTFQMDAWSDFQEQLSHVDSLSSAAGHLGARRPVRFTGADTVSDMSDVLGL